MNEKYFSKTYKVRKLNDDDITLVYNLSITNPNYYKYCPPLVTAKSIKNDMTSLPPNKVEEEKFYVGFFEKNELVALLDLIANFPENDMAFIGLFMVDKSHQGKGVGTKIISELCLFLKGLEFGYIKLAFAKGNDEAELFWKKNKFHKTNCENDNGDYVAVSMERKL